MSDSSPGNCIFSLLLYQLSLSWFFSLCLLTRRLCYWTSLPASFSININLKFYLPFFFSPSGGKKCIDERNKKKTDDNNNPIAACDLQLFHIKINEIFSSFFFFSSSFQVRIILYLVLCHRIMEKHTHTHTIYGREKCTLALVNKNIIN